MNNEELQQRSESLAAKLAFRLELNTPSQVNLQALLPFFLADLATHWQDKRELAYALATVYHETGKLIEKVIVRFAPVKETRAGAHQITLRKQQDKYWSTGYYERGLEQITWQRYYAAFEKLLDKPLLANPDLALDLETSYQILREGMHRGTFTGKRLSDYINGARCDYVNARRIINGTDKAIEIARIAEMVEEVL